MAQKKSNDFNGELIVCEKKLNVWILLRLIYGHNYCHTLYNVFNCEFIIKLFRQTFLKIVIKFLVYLYMNYF